MRGHLTRLTATLVVGMGLAAAPAAEAARQPTLKERAAITAALPAWLRSYPVGCVWLDITVSNNGRYAAVVPAALNPLHSKCLRYASNGEWILKKTIGWRIIYNGSGGPSCSLGIPTDLIKCVRS